MIRVENLTRKYGDFIAVDNVSFSISKGQVVGLLGHNGAGKTTIMKMLTGYLEPTAGTAWVADMNVSEQRFEVQQKIGYLPENSPLYPDMSVLQYLEYVCQLRDIPPEAVPAKIKSVLDGTKLRSMALRQIGTLSKGYKQRLGVAQAIIHSPQILILDEPTSGLDPSQIHEMRHLIKELSKNSTVILSTHILQEVEATCDRVIIILQGKVAADALLSEMRSSNRLVLAVDRGPETVQPTLKKVDRVKSVRHTAHEGNCHEYMIELASDSEGVVPLIARTAVVEGWQLYRLDREQKNLEAVFREINSGVSGGADGK